MEDLVMEVENLAIGRPQNKDEEIEFLESWIGSVKPDPDCNTLSLPPLPPKSQIGRLPDGSYSSFAGSNKFSQLPISEKTKQGLKESKYLYMTDIQRASLPHSLCGDRDIFGASVSGSGMTLAFVIPVLEKLYRVKWGPEDGVGCIIISPVRELARQIFEVLNSVGKNHCFCSGLLIDCCKDDIGTGKECVKGLNILVSTPNQLLKHMERTPDFDCSNLQVLVLDRADCICDCGFKKTIGAIISRLPKQRQTLMFPETLTKSVDNVGRVLKKDPVYISRESLNATPEKLHQHFVVVPPDQKLDMLWSFLNEHIHSRIVVKFIYEAFRKLRLGVSVECLHGRMKRSRSKLVLEQFFQKKSILFASDLASRGRDLTRGVDWVVQVDCPEDVSSYIYRLGRPALFFSGGKSILFLAPSETKMVDKLRAEKIPITSMVMNRFQPVSGLLSELLVKYPNLRQLAKRALIVYLRSVYRQKDKEVFDLTRFRIDEFSASFGLPMTLKIRLKKTVTNDI